MNRVGRDGSVGPGSTIGRVPYCSRSVDCRPGGPKPSPGCIGRARGSPCQDRRTVGGAAGFCRPLLRRPVVRQKTTFVDARWIQRRATRRKSWWHDRRYPPPGRANRAATYASTQARGGGSGSDSTSSTNSAISHAVSRSVDSYFRRRDAALFWPETPRVSPLAPALLNQVSRRSRPHHSRRDPCLRTD